MKADFLVLSALCTESAADLDPWDANAGLQLCIHLAELAGSGTSVRLHAYACVFRAPARRTHSTRHQAELSVGSTRLSRAACARGNKLCTVYSRRHATRHISGTCPTNLRVPETEPCMSQMYIGYKPAAGQRRRRRKRCPWGAHVACVYTRPNNAQAACIQLQACKLATERRRRGQSCAVVYLTHSFPCRHDSN